MLHPDAVPGNTLPGPCPETLLPAPREATPSSRAAHGRTMAVQPTAAPPKRPGAPARTGVRGRNIEPYRWDTRAKPSPSGGVTATLAPPVALRAPFERRERGIRDPPTGGPVGGFAHRSHDPHRAAPDSTPGDRSAALTSYINLFQG